MRKFRAYVLADEPEEKKSAYQEIKPPSMVLIPDVGKLKDLPTYTLLRNNNPDDGTQYRLAGSPEEPYKWWIMEPDTSLRPTHQEHTNVIPPAIVEDINIQGGDMLELIVDDHHKRVVISAINGRPAVKTPDIFQMSEDYPRRILPVDTWGFYGLRVMTSLSPLGLGFCGYLVAPGKAGKTSLTLEFWESNLRLTQTMKNLYVLCLSIGERPKDTTLYTKVQSAVPHDPNRVEFYSAPFGKVSLAGQWRTFEYVIARARALARHYDVVLIIDSLHQAAAADSFRFNRTTQENEGGMMAGGVYTSSMVKVKEMVSVTGDYNGKTSLSIFCVLLGNYKGRKQQEASVFAKIASDSSDNVPDVVWALVDNPLIRRYPRVDVPLTDSRRKWDFTPPLQLEEIAYLTQQAWIGDAEAPSACLTVQDYAEQHRFPGWIKDHPAQPLTPFLMQRSPNA